MKITRLRSHFSPINYYLTQLFHNMHQYWKLCIYSCMCLLSLKTEYSTNATKGFCFLLWSQHLELSLAGDRHQCWVKWRQPRMRWLGLSSMGWGKHQSGQSLRKCTRIDLWRGKLRALWRKCKVETEAWNWMMCLGTEDTKVESGGVT